jgi:hypothetical protein
VAQAVVGQSLFVAKQPDHVLADLGPPEERAFCSMTRCDRFYRCNRWDPKKIFKFPYRIYDEFAERAG